MWQALQDMLADIAGRVGELTVRTLTAAAIAAVVIGIGRLFRPLVRRVVARKNRPSRAKVFTALYQVLVALAAILLATTLAFPSVQVVDVLASLGIVSVAVGFAFKDVLENLLAGVLLLVRDPFRTGDQIVVGSHRGTIEGITVRETLLRTYDGRLVLIPNAQVYTSALEVATHYPLARTSFTLVLPADVDIAAVRAAALPVLDDLRAPEAPGSEIAATSAQRGALEVEFGVWVGSTRADAIAALDEALPRTIEALRGAGIALDEPRTVLVHDEE